MKRLAVLLLILVSGCATTKSSHIACDFVEGAADNAIERHENKGRSDIHGNIVRNNQNSDLLEGILNVLGGMLSRSVNNEQNEDCT